MSFLFRSKQLHNAGYQDGATAIIRYGFHPRCGEAVVVTSRQRYRGEVSLIIRQPDGTLAAVPAWMMEDGAAAMAVHDTPRLPLSCLRELRSELDACLGLSFPRNDSRRGGHEHGVRHRTVRTKGSLSHKTARLMVFKLVMSAAKTWRRLKGENQLPRVIAGVKFTDGVADSPTPADRAA